MKIEFIPIKTRVVNPPKDEIFDIVDGLDARDGDVVFITSKILALHQGRAVKIGGAPKEELIKREATAWLPYENKSGFFFNLTIVDNTLIPNAGIDESNANGYYILWPIEADDLCKQIRARIMKRLNLRNLGIVSTDSRTTPLRLGVTGIATGFSGVDMVRDMRGAPDIFGRPLTSTQINVIDALASMAVLLMGEGAEQTPIVILRGFDGIRFSDDGCMEKFKISPEIDIYQPLLDVMMRK